MKMQLKVQSMGGNLKEMKIVKMKNIESIKLILLKSNFKEFESALEDYNIKEFDTNGNHILHYYIKESPNLKLEYKAVIDLILSKGLDINEKQSKGPFRRSPLHISVFMKLRDITDYLIKLGANINSTDAAGNSILMTAVLWYREQNGYYIEKLINSGADLYQKNNHGKCPILSAYEIDNNDVKKFFPSIDNLK
jgi:hypothetical protein